MTNIGRIGTQSEEVEQWFIDAFKYIKKIYGLKKSFEIRSNYIVSNSEYNINDGDEFIEGDIKDLVQDFNTELPNTGISPHFGQMRIACEKKCMLDKCTICLSELNLAKSFNQVGLEIIKKKDKTIVCKDCGKEFVFTVGEQEFYAEKGFQKTCSKYRLFCFGVVSNRYSMCTLFLH